MNIKTITISALAALAASVLTAPSAKAQGFTYSNGDILVGFTQTGNNSSDYVIDLTQLDATWSTQGFKNGTANTTLTIGSALATDLAAAFGSANPTGVSFGLVAVGATGAGNDPARTVYLSEPTGGTIPNSTTAQSTQQNNIFAIAGQYGPNPGAATVSSGAILSDSANGLSSYAGSFTKQISGNLGNNQFAPLVNSISSTVDLYRLAQSSGTPGTDLGTISFNASTDAFTFTPTSLAAIPEPATALFGCAMLGAVVVARRRKTVVA